MGKAACIVLDILALAAFGGAYAVEYFSKAKLGMMRWVNYNAKALRDMLPIDLICAVVLLLLALGLMALTIVRFKKRQGGAFATVQIVLALLCVAAVGALSSGGVRLLGKPFTVIVATLAPLFALIALVIACKMQTEGK